MVSRKPQEDAKPKWYPTHTDMSDLKKKLEAYTQIRIGGKLQSRFDQYCKTVGVIDFDEYGAIVVYQPGDYKRLSDIYWKLRAIEDKERLDYLDKHPEERQKIMNKLQEMRKSFGFGTV